MEEILEMAYENLSIGLYWTHPDDVNHICIIFTPTHPAGSERDCFLRPSEGHNDQRFFRDREPALLAPKRAWLPSNKWLPNAKPPLETSIRFGF